MESIEIVCRTRNIGVYLITELEVGEPKSSQRLSSIVLEYRREQSPLPQASQREGEKGNWRGNPELGAFIAAWLRVTCLRRLLLRLPRRRREGGEQEREREGLLTLTCGGFLGLEAMPVRGEMLTRGGERGCLVASLLRPPPVA